MDKLCQKYFQTCSDHGAAPCEDFIEQLANLGIDGTDTAGRVIVLANLECTDLRCILETLRVIADNRITGVDVSGCHLTAEDARNLGRCIAESRAITALDMSASAASTIALGEFVATCHQVSPAHLMKLRLGGGALGSSSGVVIGKLLMVLHGLRNLDVSGNRLGDLGIATIGASLCAMQSDTTSMLAPPVLESLNLSDNMTSDQGLAQFCSSIDSSPTDSSSSSTWKLRHLWLSGNNIGESGIQRLVDSMSRQGGPLASLELLDVSSNPISEEYLSELPGLMLPELDLITMARNDAGRRVRERSPTPAKNESATSTDKGDADSRSMNNFEAIWTRVEAALESKIERAVSNRTVQLECQITKHEQLIASLQHKLDASPSPKQLNAVVQSLRIRLEQMEMVVFQTLPGSASKAASNSKMIDDVRSSDMVRLLGETSNRVRALEQHMLAESEAQLKLQLVIEKLLDA